MIADTYINEGFPVKTVLKVLRLARSSYYYNPKEECQKKGIAKSNITKTKYGKTVSNDQVVAEIKHLLEQEFVDYGYLKVTHWLRQNKFYSINPKKTYRLMREYGLLNKIQPKPKTRKHWVKELVPPAKKVFEYLEFDIKYFPIDGKNKNTLLITVIDVYSRWVLGHYLASSIDHKKVIKLFDQIFSVYPLPKSFYVRNDNGSQFIAEQVQQYFELNNVIQEFCKPATPEQNAHIESYHSILEKVICRKYYFETEDQLADTLNRFVKFYNFERLHSGIKYTSPLNYLENNYIQLDLNKLDNVLDCKAITCFFSNENLSSL